MQPSNGRVRIAYLHNEHVSHSWHDSMRRAHEHDRAAGGHRLAEKPLNIRCSSGRLVPSRNFACTLFLDRCDDEWLMFIDTDMGFDGDAIHRLLDAADPVERPIMGGLCFALMEANTDGQGGYRFTIVPTMYKLGTTQEGKRSFCYYGPFEPDQVTPVAATGGAFILIHRTVLEAIRARFGDHWFDQMYDGEGSIVGEDFALCTRALSLDFPIHVHTGVTTTHHKEQWISVQDYIGQNVLAMMTAEPDIPDGLVSYVDMQASLASLAVNDHVRADGMLKVGEDLDRYKAIIEATKPDLIIETGTFTGASARWFARLGPNVITIDVSHGKLAGEDPATDPVNEEIQYILGDSTDPSVFARIRRAAHAVEDLRVMVVLDSDHSAKHVMREIELYGPLVTPGCYLVVEDTIFGWAPEALRMAHFTAGIDGTPLDAVAAQLVGSESWSRDIAVERMSPVSHHPAGWWLRRG